MSRKWDTGVFCLRETEEAGEPQSPHRRGAEHVRKTSRYFIFSFHTNKEEHLNDVQP